MTGLLDSQNANASSAQLAAAPEQLTHQFGLLALGDDGRYRSAILGIGRIFQRRVAANRGLLAKDVREENAIFQDSRDFFRQAGFAVHARRDLLLLAPLQASWAELTEQRDDAPLLARILAGGPPRACIWPGLNTTAIPAGGCSFWSSRPRRMPRPGGPYASTSRRAGYHWC